MSKKPDWLMRLDVPRMLERLGISVKREVGGGRRLQASCPNPQHNDRHSSWFIRNNPGEPFHAAHSCHGCGFRGGPMLLVDALLGLIEEDAREWLQDLSQPPPLPQSIEVEIADVRKKRFALPPCFRFDPIDEWPELHRDYLLERIEPWQVERWGLGYVTKCECVNPDGKVGRHRERIAIPVRDASGAALSYTSRAIDRKARLRYVEPHESEGAKSCLFGAQHLAGVDTVVTVEGSFDAFAVEIAIQRLGKLGRVGVAALRGSSLHPVTLLRLAQFDRVIMLADPDDAGRKARDAIKSTVGGHTWVSFVVLPKGVDPSKAGPDWIGDRLVKVLAA